MYLSLLVMTYGRYTIVNITGDVDFYSSRWLQEHLLRFLPRGGAQLVVNLSQVTFIDCRGLRTLIVTCRKAEEWACSIRFSEMSSPVQRVAELTGQREAIPMAPPARQGRPPQDVSVTFCAMPLPRPARVASGGARLPRAGGA
jgi:anti-sigma B factor antagonist